MSAERYNPPRLLIAFLCSTLQLCLGTVYAWSYYQTLLVRQLGWTFTETAVAFSITIFSLGLSAAWAGAALPRLGPEAACTHRQPDVFRGLFDWRPCPAMGLAAVVLPGLRGDWRCRDRFGLCHAGGDGGQVVSGSQGFGHRCRCDGFRASARCCSARCWRRY